MHSRQFFIVRAKPSFLPAAPRKPVYQVGSQEMLPRAGYMQNTRYYLVQPIPDSDENVVVPKAVLKKLNALLPVRFEPPSISRSSAQLL